jgi:hypothetical protein
LGPVCPVTGPRGTTNDAALEDAMTLPTINQARSWRGLTLVATPDEPVGKIEAIYIDRTTRQPEWALVHTGLFGSSRTFVPLADAAQHGDTVQVPHEPSVVREAPRLEQDAELSEDDEARLYAHYGIRYTTAESSSGLPAGETGSPAVAPADATAELTPPTSRLEADAPATADAATGTGPTATPTAGDAWSSGSEATASKIEERAGRGGRAAAAGLGAVALAAIAAGLAALRRRRRRPPSLGDRVSQVGREAADALARAAEEVRRQAVAASSEGARQAAKGGRRAARIAAAGGLAATEGGRRAARKGARKAARRAGGAGRETAKSGRRAGKEAAAAVASTKATVESRRRARRRARARKRAAAATTGTARSVTSIPASVGRRVQQLDVGQRTRKVIPRRRRRSKMKVIGKLGMAVGAAVGYVLGARAGRERYEQMQASARQLLDKPQVKRVVDNAPGNLGARMEQAAHKAADKVQQAQDRVAPSGSGSSAGTTTGVTTSTTTPSTPATPSTPSTSTSTTTTPSVPSTPSTSTTTPSAPSTSGGDTAGGGAATTADTGTTTKRSSASERSSRDRTKNS